MESSSAQIFSSTETFETQSVLDKFTEHLQGLVANFDIKVASSSVFQSTTVPRVNLRDYLVRLLKYTKADESSLIFAAIYINRLLKTSTVQFNSLTAHRITLTALVLAIKYNEDDIFSNKFYSKVGGCKLNELRTYETVFCQLVKFNFFVTEEEQVEIAKYFK